MTINSTPTPQQPAALMLTMRRMGQQQQRNQQAPAAPAPEPEGALNLSQAADRLAGMLDDDGHSPNAVKDGNPSNRDRSGNQDGPDFKPDTPPKRDPGPEENDLDDNPDDDDTAPKGDDDDNTGTEEDGPDAGDDDQDADSIKSFEDLATELEMDAEALNGLTLTFKAAGEELTLPLAEIVAGYQKDADYRRGTAQLAEDRRSLDSERTTQSRTYHQEATLLAQSMGALEQSLIGNLQGPEMQELRQTDPAEWNARQLEAQQRLNEFRQFRANAANRYKEFVETNRANYLRQQGAILAREVPEWNKEKLDLAVEVVKSFGFSDAEVPEIADARLMKAALAIHAMQTKLAKYEQQDKKASVTATKVKESVPALLKGGRSGKGKGVSRSNIQKARDKVKATAHKGGCENLNAAAAAIEQMLQPMKR